HLLRQQRPRLLLLARRPRLALHRAALARDRSHPPFRAHLLPRRLSRLLLRARDLALRLLLRRRQPPRARRLDRPRVALVAVLRRRGRVPLAPHRARARARHRAGLAPPPLRADHMRRAVLLLAAGCLGPQVSDLPGDTDILPAGATVPTVSGDLAEQIA